MYVLASVNKYFPSVQRRVRIYVKSNMHMAFVLQEEGPRGPGRTRTVLQISGSCQKKKENGL